MLDLAVARRPEQRQKFPLINIEAKLRSTAAAMPKRLVTLSNRTSGFSPGTVHGAKNGFIIPAPQPLPPHHVLPKQILEQPRARRSHRP